MRMKWLSWGSEKKCLGCDFMKKNILSLLIGMLFIIPLQCTFAGNEISDSSKNIVYEVMVKDESGNIVPLTDVKYHFSNWSWVQTNLESVHKTTEYNLPCKFKVEKEERKLVLTTEYDESIGYIIRGNVNNTPYFFVGEITPSQQNKEGKLILDVSDLKKVTFLADESVFKFPNLKLRLSPLCDSISYHPHYINFFEIPLMDGKASVYLEKMEYTSIVTSESENHFKIYSSGKVTIGEQEKIDLKIDVQSVRKSIVTMPNVFDYYILSSINYSKSWGFRLPVVANKPIQIEASLDMENIISPMRNKFEDVIAMRWYGLYDKVNIGKFYYCDGLVAMGDSETFLYSFRDDKGTSFDIFERELENYINSSYLNSKKSKNNWKSISDLNTLDWEHLKNSPSDFDIYVSGKGDPLYNGRTHLKLKLHNDHTLYNWTIKNYEKLDFKKMLTVKAGLNEIRTSVYIKNFDFKMKTYQIYLNSSKGKILIDTLSVPSNALVNKTFINEISKAQVKDIKSISIECEGLLIQSVPLP